ncbi:MAG: hypothetical protein DRI90_27125, partial [Deltaproteobacteria bacterium]
TLRSPFTNGLNQVGFIGIAGNVQFLWADTGIVWLDTDETNVTLSVGGVASTMAMGFDDTGGWVYGPHVDGEDGLWTNNGLLLVRADPAPGFTAPAAINYIYAPTMLPAGQVNFVSSVDLDNDQQTDARALYVNATATPGPSNFAILLQTGDVLSGETLSDWGVDTQYQVSDDGAHYIAEVEVTGTTPLWGMAVDGAIVALEASTTGDGDNWEYFADVSINNAGNYLFSGQTDASYLTDDVLAYNGSVVVRETDTVDGVTIDGDVHGVSINNHGHAVFIFEDGSQEETLFGSCDASNLATNAFAIITANTTEVDVDGDSTADAIVTDFNDVSINQSYGSYELNLAEDGHVYLEVDLDYGQGNREAIIKVAVCCGNGNVDAGEDCDDSGETATCDNDCTNVSCGDHVTNTTAGEDCDDGAESVDCNDDCTVASCGDGVTNTTAGEDCDGNGESADCNDDCTTATCGDEKVNVTAGEDCDNGGTETGGCDDDCTFPECGDGVHNATAGEDCDDGGNSTSCDSDCSPVECGDGLLNDAAGEECEDGNTADGDGCSADCLNEGSSSSSGTGGSSSSGTGGAGGEGAATMVSEADSGCGCRVVGAESSRRAPWGAGVLAALLALGLNRRRRRRA